MMDVNRDLYYAVVLSLAGRCIADDPFDPRSVSMEYANDDVVGELIDVKAVLRYTSSLGEATAQRAGEEKDEFYEFALAVDCLDWDICKQIGLMERDALEGALEDGSEVEL